MRIVVNGQEKDLPEGLSIAALIREMGLANAACAAEVNKTLVPKRDHDARELREGDTVELVTLVGGG